MLVFKFAGSGRAGYILEGTELAFYIKKMAKKKSGKKE